MDFFNFFWLIWLVPLFIIGAVVFAVARFLGRRRRAAGAREKDWYLQVFLSKEDAVSQLFFLLSVLFLGITLLAVNKEIGEPLSWRAILLLVSVVGVGIAYYFKVIYTLAVSLLGFAAWWGAQAAEWAQGKDIKAATFFAGLALIMMLFYLLGCLHRKEIRLKRASLVYLMLGLISITAALFFLSTRLGLRLLGETTKGVSFFASWEITASFFIFFLCLAGLLFYTLARKLIFAAEALAIGLLIILFAVLALIPEQSIFLQQKGYYGVYRGEELSSTGVLWAIFFNILIFLEIVGILLLGYMKRERWLINLGAFLIFILIFVKYFDWFFTFLDKSVFFIVAGILLFVVGWFMERGRRYVISAMKPEEVKQNQ